MFLARAKVATTFPVAFGEAAIPWKAGDEALVDDKLLSRYQAHPHAFELVLEPGQIAGMAPVPVLDNFTLTKDENGATVVSMSADPITITVPAGLPAGFGCAIVQYGAGQVTVADDGTSTVANLDSQLKTSGQGATIALVNDTTDSYRVLGQTGA